MSDRSGIVDFRVSILLRESCAMGSERKPRPTPRAIARSREASPKKALAVGQGMRPRRAPWFPERRLRRLKTGQRSRCVEATEAGGGRQLIFEAPRRIRRHWRRRPPPPSEESVRQVPERETEVVPITVILGVNSIELGAATLVLETRSSTCNSGAPELANDIWEAQVCMPVSELDGHVVTGKRRSEEKVADLRDALGSLRHRGLANLALAAKLRRALAPAKGAVPMACVRQAQAKWLSGRGQRLVDAVHIGWRARSAGDDASDVVAWRHSAAVALPKPGKPRAQLAGWRAVFMVATVLKLYESLWRRCADRMH